MENEEDADLFEFRAPTAFDLDGMTETRSYATAMMRTGGMFCLVRRTSLQLQQSKSETICHVARSD